MVSRHLRARGIDDPLLLAAMGAVPREAFVPEHLQEFSYEDSALPIEAGQTISQPYIVARMIELAEIKPGDKVLEVGAGSGYAAAVMSRMANKVFAIERHEELAQARPRPAEAARLRQCRDHYRRRHQGLARGSALPGDHRLCRRPACSRSSEAAACHRRAADHPGRGIRLSDADARSPHRRGQLQGGGFRRRGLRAADRRGRLGRA